MDSWASVKECGPLGVSDDVGEVLPEGHAHGEDVGDASGEDGVGDSTAAVLDHEVAVLVDDVAVGSDLGCHFEDEHESVNDVAAVASDLAGVLAEEEPRDDEGHVEGPLEPPPLPPPPVVLDYVVDWTSPMPADNLTVMVGSGTIAFYVKTRVLVAVCRCAAHRAEVGGCRKERARFQGRGLGQGRPIGFLASWLGNANEYANGFQHKWHCQPGHEARMLARYRLGQSAEGRRILRCERKAFEGDGLEPLDSH